MRRHSNGLKLFYRAILRLAPYKCTVVLLWQAKQVKSPFRRALGGPRGGFGQS
jgi:hypothetical protein